MVVLFHFIFPKAWHGSRHLLNARRKEEIKGGNRKGRKGKEGEEPRKEGGRDKGREEEKPEPFHFHFLLIRHAAPSPGF